MLPSIDKVWLIDWIAGLAGAHTVADDILISDKDDTFKDAVKDDKKNLLALLVRCREKGVKLDKDKLKLKMSKVPYVDHMLPKDGLGPGQSKVGAI